MTALGASLALSQVPDRPVDLGRLESKAPRPAEAAKPPASAASLFRTHCLDCHAANGRGESLFPSIPDFTDARWQASHTDQQLRRSILEGKGKSMPAMKGKLSADDVTTLLVLIREFRGGRQLISEDEETNEPPSVSAGPTPAVARPSGPRAPDPPATAARTAAPLFQRSCRVCHGPDGRGDLRRTAMPEIPDFSNRTWQERHGRAELTASILEGRGAHMPGFGDTLSAQQVRELVDFVRAFGPAAAPSADSPAGDFDIKLSQLQAEFEALRREYRSISPRPR
jgi:mono/diheme cytochrome c family protein